jgi:CRP/FNR family transcriptional regulator
MKMEMQLSHAAAIAAPLVGNRAFARVSARSVSASCSDCALRMHCVPAGIPDGELRLLGDLAFSRRRLRPGEHLYRTGDPFRSLYALRSGFFKTYVDGADSESHIIAFPMAGEVVGLDGFGTDTHQLNVVTLDDGEACVIPYGRFESLAMRVPSLQRQLHKLMSREIVREQELMTLLRGMRAEARVAAFLLALSAKFAARGYSATQFRLRMTREDIGSYLGLQLETVSRVISRFHGNGWIAAHARSITIADAAKLGALVPNL